MAVQTDNTRSDARTEGAIPAGGIIGSVDLRAEQIDQADARLEQLKVDAAAQARETAHAADNAAERKIEAARTRDIQASIVERIDDNTITTGMTAAQGGGLVNSSAIVGRGSTRTGAGVVDSTEIVGEQLSGTFEGSLEAILKLNETVPTGRVLGFSATDIPGAYNVGNNGVAAASSTNGAYGSTYTSTTASVASTVTTNKPVSLLGRQLVADEPDPVQLVPIAAGWTGDNLADLKFGMVDGSLRAVVTQAHSIAVDAITGFSYNHLKKDLRAAGIDKSEAASLSDLGREQRRNIATIEAVDDRVIPRDGIQASDRFGAFVATLQ